MLLALAAAGVVETTSSFINWVAVERATVIGVLLFFIGLLIRGTIVTRKTSDEEKAALVAGQAAKDEAHEHEVAYLNDRVAYLESELDKRDNLIEKREQQLGQVLDEIAPSVIAWANATQLVADEAVGGEDGNVES